MSMTQEKMYMNVDDVCAVLGVSKAFAYDDEDEYEDDETEEAEEPAEPDDAEEETLPDEEDPEEVLDDEEES